MRRDRERRNKKVLESQRVKISKQTPQPHSFVSLYWIITVYCNLVLIFVIFSIVPIVYHFCCHNNILLFGLWWERSLVLLLKNVLNKPAGEQNLQDKTLGL